MPQSQPPKAGLDESLLDAMIRGDFGAGDAQARAQLEAWLEKHPDKRREYDALQGFWQTLGRMQVDPAVLRDEGHIPAPRRSGIWSAVARSALAPRYALASACTLLIALGAAWLFSMQQRSASDQTTVSIIETMRGGSRSLTLADGSRVDLNADSRIEVQFDPSTRRITLRKGEALFSVAKDARRPFVVATDLGAVTAVGTQFDVRIYPSHVAVAVAEGVVQVTPGGVNAAAGQVPPSTVSAGQQVNVVADAASAFVERLGPVDSSIIASWRWGKLTFHGQSLAEAVVDVNRHSEKLRLQVTGGAGAIPVYGVFDVGDVRGFESAIKDRIAAADPAIEGDVQVVDAQGPE